MTSLKKGEKIFYLLTFYRSEYTETKIKQFTEFVEQNDKLEVVAENLDSLVVPDDSFSH